jgi:hypothetical protein
VGKKLFVLVEKRFAFSGVEDENLCLGLHFHMRGESRSTCPNYAEFSNEFATKRHCQSIVPTFFLLFNSTEEIAEKLTAVKNISLHITAYPARKFSRAYPCEPLY